MATGSESLILKFLFFFLEKIAKLLNKVFAATVAFLVLFTFVSFLWIKTDNSSKIEHFVDNFYSAEDYIQKETDAIESILKQNLTDEQLKPILGNLNELEKALEPKFRSLYLWKIVPILYYGLLFIILAILFHTTPVFNTKIASFIERKIDIKGWPLAYLFNLDDIETDKISESKTLPAYIANLWYLAEKNRKILENLNNVIKIPLDRLIGCYIAEVTDQSGKKIKNVALVRIRYADGEIINSDSSKGSLIYEGIGIDTTGDLTFWHSSPLCIDLFSLPQNVVSSIQSSSLLFKTTKGKITKFSKRKEPNINSEKAENFGDIKIPRDYFKGNISDSDHSITGWFTDIIIENGTAKTTKNKANLRPFSNQVSSYKITKPQNVKIKGEMLIDKAFELTKLYDKSEEISAAERYDHIEASTQLVEEFETFVKSGTDWKKGSIFANYFRSEGEESCEH